MRLKHSARCWPASVLSGSLSVFSDCSLRVGGLSGLRLWRLSASNATRFSCAMKEELDDAFNSVPQ